MSIEKGQPIKTTDLDNVVGYGVGKKISDFNEITTVNENTVILADNNGQGGKITIKKLKSFLIKPKPPTITSTTASRKTYLYLKNNENVEMICYANYDRNRNDPTPTNYQYKFTLPPLAEVNTGLYYSNGSPWTLTVLGVIDGDIYTDIVWGNGAH